MSADFVPGNQVTLLESGSEYFPALIAAIDEAQQNVHLELCFGWIDSILKPIDREKYAQRFSPRKKNSQLSDMNKERIRRLIRSRRMTRAGLEAIQHRFDHSEHRRSPHIPPDILKALQRDKTTWRNFSRFPDSYKRIRIGWIHGSRRRPDIFRQRLNYFLKMTKQNKRFGMVQ